jgi:hypothetical protein
MRESSPPPVPPKTGVRRPSGAEFQAWVRENLRRDYGLDNSPEVEQYARVRWQMRCLEEALATLPGLREPAAGNPLATLAWFTRIGKLRAPLERAYHQALRNLSAARKLRPRGA